MRKGSKYINRATRRVVTIKETYIEKGSGRKVVVVNYLHPRLANSTRVGALYIDDFKRKYRPKPLVKTKAITATQQPFTQVPWIINSTDKFSKLKGFAITDFEGNLIATVSYNTKDIDECVANAKLIRAAPALLKALQKVVDYQERGHKLGGGSRIRARAYNPVLRAIKEATE